VWRVAHDGRDLILGVPSASCWCDGTFDVLYTPLERDGALAGTHALLTMQPVFPSKIRFFVHQIRVSVQRTLRLADLPALRKLGVEVDRYQDREYSMTQQIADAAYFLGFDGLIAPCARWECLNASSSLTESLQAIEIVEREPDAIDWEAWRKRTRSR
jgi:RES domain